MWHETRTALAPEYIVAPLESFRTARGLSREEVGALVAEHAGAGTPAGMALRIARLEAGLIDPAAPELAPVWDWLQSVGVADAQAQHQAWWRAQR